MNMTFFYRAILVALLPVIFASCAKRVVTTDSTMGAKAVLDAALRATPELCAYKGRIAITLDSGEGKFSFSALLDKECSGDFKLTVLGALNRPLFELMSDNGTVTAAASDEEMKKSVLAAGREYAGVLSLLLRSPLMLPAGVPSLKTGDNEYELTYTGGTVVVVDDKFRFVRYIHGNGAQTYAWKESAIGSIIAANGNQSLTIRFMNGEGWH